jgi:hypothetical protein
MECEVVRAVEGGKFCAERGYLCVNLDVRMTTWMHRTRSSPQY